MWVCKNCNEVNQDDSLASCGVCSIDREIVLNAKDRAKSWSCMSCGKINSIKIMKCPVCNSARFKNGAARAESRTPAWEETADRIREATLDLLDRVGRGKLAFGLLALLLVVTGGYAWLNRTPSDKAVKANFEATELARINAAFVGSRIDNLDAMQNGPADDMKVVSAMVQRLALDCRERMPSAVLLDKTRENNGPEDFKKDLLKLAGAVDRYVNDKMGPFGDGYSLKNVKVTRSQKGKTDDGTIICTVDYDATLTALGDVMVYLPQYLDGQEFAPLTENNAINLDNFDRFYKAYLDRNTDKSIAAAVEFNKKRGNRILSRGESQVVRGKMVFIKTGAGWQGPAGAARPAG